MLRFILTASILCAIATASAFAQRDTATPKPSVGYYFGEIKVLDGRGSVTATQLSLLKRTTIPGEHQIIEKVINIGPKDSAREYTTVYTVTDSAFTMRDLDSGFTGEGKLVGKPWGWSAWRYSATVANDVGTIASEDKLSEDGIVGSKSFFTPDGRVGAHFTERLRSISRELYDILRARLLKN